jgi:hypothetical protein
VLDDGGDNPKPKPVQSRCDVKNHEWLKEKIILAVIFYLQLLTFN